MMETTAAATNGTTTGAAIRTPSGTVTFLFSDIEGSTQLLHRLGPRYAEVLEAQRRLLRDVFAATGGREIDTAGDGFFVAFHQARDAVAAAVAAQRALAAHPWPDEAAVRVRMSLHTGEPIVAGGGYVGLDVHRAARICAVGYGGQVLLSQATRQLVVDGLPDGVRLRDLGSHQLKDFPQPERLAQLDIPGLPSDFPPLRTKAARFDNLPLPLTPLVGREQEVETVQHLLARETVRLVTLTGPGGTGKTRLALQAAAGLDAAFADGVCFVPLAPVRDPAMVEAALAAALGLAEHPGRAVLDDLKDFVRERHLLLVIDNFEQVALAAPVVATLLAAGPRLKVLATSRIVLHLSGEYEYQVPPLALPDPRRLPPPETLSQYAAVTLFVQRAQAARPGFVLTDDNAADVARICARLDGLPLAIELAAARAKLFAPQAMLARLSNRLDLLTGGVRDVSPRHQTLRQAIAWSYDLLSETEQAFFRRLSVFMSGCTLEQAGQVCTACDDLAASCSGCTVSPDALDAVAALVDQSLIRQEEGPGGEPRFVMLETIREYAAEQLRDAGEEDAVQRAHAACFLALAEQAEPELTRANQGLWLDRLETEHDNLRAALDWAEAQGEAEFGLCLGAALWRFWITRGHLREGCDRLNRLLAAPGAQSRTPARAKALNGAATLLHESGSFSAARPLLAESLAIYRALGDERGAATVLNNLGWIAGMENDIEAMAAFSKEALALCRALGDRRGTAVALTNLGWWAFVQGKADEAEALGRESLVLRQAIGDRRGYAYMLTILGTLATYQGRFEQAHALIDEALPILRDLDDRQLVANALLHKGHALHLQGHHRQAAALMEESLMHWRQVDNGVGAAEALMLLGSIALYLGDPLGARRLAEESLAIWREIDLQWGMAEAHYYLGRAACAAGDLTGAARAHSESLAFWLAMGGRRGLAENLEGMAEVAAVQGEPDRAAHLLGAAEAGREAVGMPMPPCCRAACDDLVARLRAALGPAFDAAWAAGRALSPEAACAEARSA